jgi:hypothetical protein
MSNTIILTSEKKSMFMNAGNAEGGRVEIDGQGTFMTIVGDAFVNIEASEDYQEKIQDQLNKETLVAEFDISDVSKQHIVNLTYNKTFRAIAIIGITDIDVNMTDDEEVIEMRELNVAGKKVKMLKTQVPSVSFISNKVLFMRTEKGRSTSKKTNRTIRFYLLKRS